MTLPYQPHMGVQFDPAAEAAAPNPVDQAAEVQMMDTLAEIASWRDFSDPADCLTRATAAAAYLEHLRWQRRWEIERPMLSPRYVTPEEES